MNEPTPFLPRKWTAREINAPFLNNLMRGQTIAVGALGIMVAIGGLFNRQLFALLPLALVAIFVGIVSSIILRQGNYQLSGSFFFVGTSVAISMNVYVRGYQDASTLYYLWPILGAISILGARGSIITLIYSILSYLALALSQYLGYLHPPIPFDPQKEAFLTMGSFVIMFLLLAYLARLSSQNTYKALWAAQDSSTKLQELNVTLENRVTERTRALNQSIQQAEKRAGQLQAIAEVGRQAAQERNLDQLLSTITKLISSKLGFYHIGIFLLDDDRQYAVLRASNSEGGQKMLARGHRLGVGQQGIVGYVTSRGQARVALNVGEEAIYFNNPDLPATCSEVALPLKFGQEVIGALDIQSIESNAFSQEDVELFSILADQVSVAIQNARSLEQAQHALREADSATRQLTGQAWTSFSRSMSVKGFHFDGSNSQPLKDTVELTENGVLKVPVQVRGQQIANLMLKTPEPDYQWPEDEIAMIQAAAERVGLALENARLLEDAQHRASRERVIGDIAASISTSSDMEGILRTAVQVLGRRMGGAEVILELGTEADDQ